MPAQFPGSDRSTQPRDRPDPDCPAPVLPFGWTQRITQRAARCPVDRNPSYSHLARSSPTTQFLPAFLFSVWSIPVPSQLITQLTFVTLPRPAVAAAHRSCAARRAAQLPAFVDRDQRITQLIPSRSARMVQVPRLIPSGFPIRITQVPFAVRIRCRATYPALDSQLITLTQVRSFLPPAAFRLPPSFCNSFNHLPVPSYSGFLRSDSCRPLPAPARLLPVTTAHTHAPSSFAIIVPRMSPVS